MKKLSRNEKLSQDTLVSAAADMPATNQVEALAAAPVMTKEMNARDLARAEKM